MGVVTSGNFRESLKLVAAFGIGFFVMVVMSIILPYAPCPKMAFFGMVALVTSGIIFFDRIEKLDEIFYAWIAGYLIVWLIVGSTVFQQLNPIK